LSEENQESPDLEQVDDLDVIEEIEPVEPEFEPVAVVFDGKRGYVGAENCDKISQQGFYGTRTDDGRLELEPVEMLHLLERKRLSARNKTGKVIEAKDIVSSLIHNDPDLWVRYLVFRDLRSRGYAVRQGFGGGIGFRVYARGDLPGKQPAKELIYVLREGVPISLNDLDRVTESAGAARKRLLFALVDQNGEVNYYKVAQTTLKDRSVDTI
jgi:tRNA-intron endonuclease